MDQWRGAEGDATPIQLNQAPRKVLVKPIHGIDATFSTPPSKSYTHRALFAALHSRRDSIIENPLFSGDTLASLQAIEAFGATYTLHESSLQITGVDEKYESPREVFASGSATTLRFSMGVAALQGERPILLQGDESLNRRPVEPLAIALQRLGAEVSTSHGTPPVTVRGPLHPGREPVIDAGISSQFASSLLMIGPQAGFDTLFIERLSSKPYLDITIRVMEAFGVRVEIIEQYHVYGLEGSYRGGLYRVPGDYSSASYLLALGALAGRARVKGLDPLDPQPDRILLKVLEGIGVRVRWTSQDTVEVEAPVTCMEPFEINIDDSPDLAPTLAVLAAYACGVTSIHGVKRLRFKESNRAKLITEALTRMGARIEQDEDTVRIHGKGTLEGGVTVDAGGDHRIAMSLAIAALAARKPTVITGFHRIGDSFPGFLEELEKAGINIEEVS